MKRWLRYLAFALALAFLVLTVVNASWLAPEPKGAVKLIAHRGIHQLYDHAGVGRDTCTADRIDPPAHDYLENTTRSIARAAGFGAHMIEVDIAPTADDQIAVFHDWTVDCRTDGTGEVRDLTMAELKALDAGYGYTADDGRTYPFRGEGIGAIPTLEEAIRAAGRARLLYNFKSKDPAEADLLAAALEAAGRDPVAAGDAFYGDAANVARIREHYPDAWAFSIEGAKECTSAYLLSGWFGIVPEACEDGTLMVPLDRQWLFAGWPNRLIARMEEAGAHVIVIGPRAEDRPTGLDLPEQLGEIPASFNGYAWVEDSFTVVPALINRFDNRSQAEIDAAQASLERRRAER